MMGIFGISIALILTITVFLFTFGRVGIISKMKIKSFVFFAFSFLVLFATAFQLNAQVHANFSYTANPVSRCPPVTVTFNNFSTGATSYSWVFGNGNTSTLTNPSASYTAGTYHVKLTATAGGSTSDTTITIVIYTKPIPNFTTSTVPSCIGEAVIFTDNSTAGSGTLSSWLWDFGDGTTIPNNTTGTVTHIYVTAGVNIPISMKVTDANGCTNDTIKKITIAADPIASFTGSPNPTTSCSPPFHVDFANTSTISGAATYLWKFGDGTPPSTQSSPSHTYNAAGTFTVTLIVTQGGCIDSIVKTNFVSIVNGTVANFNADNTTPCAGQVVTFTDNSTPITGTQLWDFGDGVTSTATNPTHTYAAAGVYDVKLIEGSAGCQNTITVPSYITVSPSPTVAFSTVDTQSCALPFIVHFINASTPGAIFNWDFGDGITSGLTNPVHTYFIPGLYTVTLTVTSGSCIIPLVKTNYIKIPKPVANFTAAPYQGCIPLHVNFTSTSTSPFDSIVSYHWNFGNGTATTPNASDTYNSIGSFNVKLVVQTTKGCKDSITKLSYIKTGSPPTPGFAVVTPTVCFGTPAVFTDQSVGADSAFWRFDANEGTFSTPPNATMPFNPVTNLFPDTGTFYVRQIVFKNGCADSLQKNHIVTVLPPKPLFAYQLNCTNYYSVSFVNESQGADSIVWNFGDGSPLISNVQNPVHAFASRGIKTVTITAFHFVPYCSSPSTQVFTIAQPIAKFKSDTAFGCWPLNLTFSNTSQDAFTDSWNFGDGNGTYPINFSPFPYTYFTPKLDTVKLIITDVNGCMDSITHVITVYGPLPGFNANLTTGCAPFPVVLTDASVSDSALVKWTWNFGDGTSQTVVAPTVNHTYATPGLYNVTMIVTDKNHCTDSLPKNQYIQPTFPVPAFVTDTFACRNVGIPFDASSSNVIQPATYTWNFGDGTPNQAVTIPVTTHIYTADNLYTVTLTVTDINGCHDSIKHQIRIQHPHAAFNDSVPLIGCGITQMHYRDLSTGLAIIGWHWIFGDGASSLQENPHHNYTVPGPYFVTLIVTNSAGCTDSIVDSVFVPGPSGTFSFTPNIGCPPLTVTFTAVSSTATSYTWDFGDGTVISNSPNAVIQHTYTQDRVATPQLSLNSILPDGTPCIIAATPAGVVTIKTILPIDSIYSNVTSGCNPLIVNFFDGSTVPPGIPNDTINGWSWDFGDGTTSALKNPTHLYAQFGVYSVTLKVTTHSGCGNNNSSAPYIITVHPHPIAAFNVNKTSFDLPYDATICTNQSTGAITYNWNFGDGGTSTDINSQHLYSTVGIQQIQLIASSQYGCLDTAYKKVVTNADVVYPNAFTPNTSGPTGGAYTLFSLDNDVFFPYTDGVTEYSLQIFDRWGELVFESSDVKKGWDGYYKGKLCDQGVYVWKAYIKLNNGKDFYKNGDVTLLR